MTLKGFLAGSVGAVVLLGPQLSYAWPVNADQRGWVDFIDLNTYPGPIAGPTQTLGFHGWACVRPGLNDYGVPPTSVAIYYATTRNGPRTRLSVLPGPKTETRADVYAAGACAIYDTGFSVWVAKPVSTQAYYFVHYLGPYGEIELEGQSYF
ncbi:hypothetical protein CYFUS_002623 [Cystobacter fuscus]|uniref:Uncharacterized protein n=1 Tax=Cystobacter fuscus TaxID=43 RepID=A0A250J152_9BACT|nr:hypothetical protein CYFUS_002623 [Cystobacter fuscus]